MYKQVICTDGACTKNGKHGAKAGVGVYFGEDDARNISTPLEGPVQTNNRAELRAFIHALEFAVDNPTVQVHIESDSSYCIKGYKTWIFSWVSRKWTKSNGGDVMNRDLWQEVWDLKLRMKEMGVTPVVSWVRGHNGHEGNEAADRLAVEGARAHLT